MRAAACHIFFIAVLLSLLNRARCDLVRIVTICAPPPLLWQRDTGQRDNVAESRTATLVAQVKGSGANRTIQAVEFFRHAQNAGGRQAA
jgi:hypothetical protein